jgi:hypothetical protein
MLEPGCLQHAVEAVPLACKLRFVQRDTTQGTTSQPCESCSMLLCVHYGCYATGADAGTDIYAAYCILQARAKLGSTATSISQLYGRVEQTTAATAGQLEATAAVLQQAASSRPAEEAVAEPGPEQVCIWWLAYGRNCCNVLFHTGMLVCA